VASWTDISARSALLRLRAVRLQLETAFTVCSTAENALLLRRVREARQAIQNAKHTAHWVHVHLDEPNHVPADSLADTRDTLVELESLVSRLEAQLQP